jgi:hypothetical protein
VEECGPCPVFASFTLAFVLQLRRKHVQTSVRVRKTCHGKKNLSEGKKTLSQGKKNLSQVKKNLRVQYTYYQNTHILQNPHKHTHYKTFTNTHITKQTHTHITKPSQAHTLQNPHKHTHYKTNTHITKHTHYKTNTHTLLYFTLLYLTIAVYYTLLTFEYCCIESMKTEVFRRNI